MTVLRRRQFLGLAVGAIVSPAMPLRARSPASGLEGYFAALVERRGFNGAVLATDRGRIVCERAYGLARVAPPTAMTPGATFAYASVSKLFTATAILQLAERGRIDIDAPAARYLPGFPFPDITLANLLSHTSGLPSFSRFFGPRHEVEPGRVFTNRDLVAGMARASVPLLHVPGTRSNYDNVNFALLALIVERVSGQSYPAYIRRNILVPAGMRDTRFLPVSDQVRPGTSSRRLVVPYHFPTAYADTPVVGTGIAFARDYWGTYAFNGFGDYVGTMRDLMRFAAHYDHLIGPAMRTRAFTVSRMATGAPHPNRIGLSWYVGSDAPIGRRVFHAGAGLGLSCILLRNLDRDQTVVVFSNMQPDVNGIAFDAMRLLNGVTVDLPRRSLARDYVRSLLRDGAAAATALITRLAHDPGYVLDEGELNIIAYDLLRPADPFRLGIAPQPVAALEAFRTNLALHPQSWNAYDSYGEALRMMGRRTEAISMYSRSLELHENPGGRQALEALRAGH